MIFKNQIQRSFALLLVGACLISFSGVWVKLVQVPSTSSAFYRVFFEFLFLLPAAFFKSEIKPKSKKKFFLVTACGLLFGLDLYFWHASILFIGPGLVTILANFQVFGMALADFVIFKEKISLLFIISVPLALTGLFSIVGVDWNSLGTDYKTSIYYGFVTAACYISFLLILRKLQSEHGEFSLFYYLMMVSFISSFFLGIMMIGSDASFAIPDMKSFFSLVALGLFSQCIGWIFIANGMPHIQASFAGLVLLLQPSLAFVWDVVFFTRSTDLVNWTGVALTLTAIYMGMTGKKNVN